MSYNEICHLFSLEQILSHQQCNAYEICDMCPPEQYQTHLQCENCDMTAKEWLWIHLQGHIYVKLGCVERVLKIGNIIDKPIIEYEN